MLGVAIHGIFVAMEAFDLIVIAMHTCQHPGVNFKQRPYVYIIYNMYLSNTILCDNYMPIICTVKPPICILTNFPISDTVENLF